jgi:protein TonB
MKSGTNDVAIRPRSDKGVIQARLGAFISMALLAPATFALVIAMNDSTKGPEEKTSAFAVSFDVKSSKKQKQQKQQKAIRHVKQQKTRRSAPKLDLPPALGAGLSGIELDLSDYDIGDELKEVGKGLLGDMNVAMTQDTVDTVPVPVETEQPEYPKHARVRGIEGSVTVGLLVGADGRVKKLKVIESDPNGVFDRVALQAVRRWLFKPATFKGQPVEMWATLPLEFRLRS